jgi:predicted ester cyclase
MGVVELNKGLVSGLLAELAAVAPGGAEEVLGRYCHQDVVWEVFHPFNSLRGVREAAEVFWEPLKASFPDYEQRLGLVIGDTYEGRDVVSTLGNLMGTHAGDWIGIPSTHALTFLRFGTNTVVRDGKIAKMYILLDIVDVLRQTGHYPLRTMPGSAEQWPLPPLPHTTAHHTDLGTTTLRIIREMQSGLASGEELKDLAATRSRHSPHWHENMNWYGPAGIGSTRGQRGFLDYHGALFIQAFPDRTGYPRDPDGPEHQPGHYIQAGDGHYAVTGGWPSLHGTHTGGAWLGTPPTGRHITMRVADWYRTDHNNKIIDNWVMIDIPDILHQMGLDILDDLRYFTNPTLPRWPR